MSQEPLSPETVAQSSEHLPESAIRSHFGVWILRRIVCCVGTMFLTFIAVMLIVDWYNPRMVWPGRDSWIWLVLNLDLTRLRVGRIAAVGFAVGFLIPDHQLPNWLTRPLLGMVLGMFIAVFVAGVLDSILAERAISKAYAPFAKMKLAAEIDRPLSYQKLYPSAYRIVFSRMLAEGAVLGLLAGTAFCLRAEMRSIVLVLITLVTAVLLVDLYQRMSPVFDRYVPHRQESIQRWLNRHSDQP